MKPTLTDQLLAAKVLAEEMRIVLGNAHTEAVNSGDRFAEIAIMNALKQAVIMEREVVELHSAAR